MWGLCPYATEFCTEDKCPNAHNTRGLGNPDEDFDCKCTCDCDEEQATECAMDI